MKEHWKNIPDYKGHYQISNLGNIKSLKQNTDKFLKPCNDGRGYYKIKLYMKGKVQQYKIHQLVAITYLNHKPDGYNIIVDHIDGNTLNNKLSNLQLISNRENTSKDKWKYNKTSKYTGVSFDNQGNRWKSGITSNKIYYNLGSFQYEIDASIEYQNALIYINKHDNLYAYNFKIKRRNKTINTDSKHIEIPQLSLIQ